MRQLFFILFLTVLTLNAQDKTAFLEQLKRTAAEGKVYMGHHDDTFYGHSWTRGACVKSDLEELSGHRPMVLSVDLCPLELQNGYYMSGSTWEEHRRAIIEQHRRGGITAISWHMYNPATGKDAWDVSDTRAVRKILRNTAARKNYLHFLDLAADYIQTLRDDNGELIPIIFRPFHESQGSWFWWGRNLCSSRDFIKLWRFTHQYLTQKGCTNLLYCFSISGVTRTVTDYLERFPGPDYVDILGTEVYRDNSLAGGIEAKRTDFIRRTRQNLAVVQQLGQRWNKPICIAESGGENTEDTEWWTRAVLPALEGYPVCYINFWANQHPSFGGGKGKAHCTYLGAIDSRDFLKALRTGRLVMCE